MNWTSIINSSIPLSSLPPTISFSPFSCKLWQNHYKISHNPIILIDTLPLFLLVIAVEFIVRCWQGKSTSRLHNTITSLSSAILCQLPVPILRWIEFSVYIWVYERFSWIELSTNSWITWLLGFIGVDFCYYWVHRASHEVNLFWAAHQVHHSSESFDLSVALRQSTFQKYFSWIFYMPMAFFLSPSIFLALVQFNFIYQFWIHTEMLTRLGFIELIFNTPSHHRVHHGRNPSCIDKNYGGTLIIFDKLFGTFQDEEHIEEDIAYGTVHLLTTCDPIQTQLITFKTIWRELSGNQIVRNLEILFKGPSWAPDKPRLGNPSERVKVSGPIPFYQPSCSSWWKMYVTTHFLIIFALFCGLHHIQFTGNVPVLIMTVYLVFSLVGLGNLLDCRTHVYGLKLEIVRCFVTVLMLIFVKYQILFCEMMEYLNLVSSLLLTLFTISSFTLITFHLLLKIISHSKQKVF